jgi:hypothetical protein
MRSVRARHEESALDAATAAAIDPGLDETAKRDWLIVISFYSQQERASRRISREKAAAGLRISDGFLRITPAGMPQRLIKPYRPLF